MNYAPVDQSVSRLGAAIKDLCATLWREESAGWQVVGRWTRRYSEVQLIEVKSTQSTHRLIAKRAVRHADNAAHYARGDVALNEFRALRQAEVALRDMADGGVPQTYGLVSGENWILMEYVSGSQLDRQLVNARWLTPPPRQAAVERHFTRLGEWLRHYQQHTATSIPIEGAEVILAECQRRLTDLHDLAPEISSDFVTHVVGRLQSQIRRMGGPLEGSSCHGDFGPWNVLVTHDSLTVIDFFCHHHDLLWFDPLNVVTYLQTQQLSFSLSRRRVQRLLDAFLQGYGRNLDVASPDFQLCLAFQQVSRLQDAVASTSRSWFERYRRRKLIRELVRQLVGKRSFPDSIRLNYE